jgi:hypothetical protein
VLLFVQNERVISTRSYFIPSYTDSCYLASMEDDMAQKPYDLAELVRRWGREELTVEQTVGQLLIWLGLIVERLEKLEAVQRGRQSGLSKDKE